MKNKNLSNKIILERLTSFLLIILVFCGGMSFLMFIIMQIMDYPIFQKNAEDIFWQAMMVLLYLTVGIAAINVSLNVRIVADYFASRVASADNAYVKQSVGMIRLVFLSVCLMLALFGYFFYHNHYRQETKYIKGNMKQLINLFSDQLEMIAHDVLSNRNSDIDALLEELSAKSPQSGRIEIIFPVEKDNELIFLRRLPTHSPAALTILPIPSEVFYPASHAQRAYLEKTILQNRNESKVFGRPPYNYHFYQPIFLEGKVAYFLYVNRTLRW